MTRVAVFAIVFFAVSVATVFAARRRWRELEPLFPLFELAPRDSWDGWSASPVLVTGRGVDVPLGSLSGCDLLDFTRCLSQIDTLPETADPTEALAW